jgi:hypothetical protein
MARAILTNEIPTLEEFGDSLGLSKSRQRSLIDIVRNGANGRPAGRTPARKTVKRETPRRKTTRAKAS